MAEKCDKKLAAKYGISEEQVEEYRDAFEVFDKDKDGTITVKELQLVMENIGQKCTLAEAKSMIAEVDTDHNESIELEEFIQMMQKKSKQEKDGKDELKEAFKAFDKNGDGKISHSELKIVMHSLGNDMDDSDIDQMIQAADQDGDHEISFEEFKAMMKSTK